MNDVETLHTWARSWLARRANLIFEQSHSIFGIQFLTIQALLNNVLSVVPDEFDTFEALYDALLITAQTASNRVPKDMVGRNPGSAEKVAYEERERFKRALEAFDRGQIAAQKPLPYTRTLLYDEAVRLWRQAIQRWGLKHNHWYPIFGPPRPQHVLAFHIDKFGDGLKLATLHQILRKHGVERVFEFSEGSPTGIQGGFPELEVELGNMLPRYGVAGGGVEGYWFSKDLDWLIYASHESSITIGGEWLLEAVRRAWPTWKEGLYEKYPIACSHLGDYKPDGASF